MIEYRDYVAAVRRATEAEDKYDRSLQVVAAEVFRADAAEANATALAKELAFEREAHEAFKAKLTPAAERSSAEFLSLRDKALASINIAVQRAEAAESKCEHWEQRALTAEEQVAHLEARIESLRRDAERYLWLRECQSIPADILLNHHEALDAAIDALGEPAWRR